MNNNLSPNESLAIIEQAIKNAKQRYQENGWVYILWGLLISITSFSQFYLLHIGKYEISWYPYLLMPLGGILTGILKAKEEKKTYSPLNRLESSLWITTALNIMILAFAFFPILKSNLVPIILVLLGIATIVSATMIRSTLLFISGLVINISGFICFSLEWQYHPLLSGIVSIVAILVPGVIFFIKNKSHV